MTAAAPTNNGVVINADNFKEKLIRLCQSAASRATTFLFVLGQVDPDRPQQSVTSQLHLWLLQYEFSETALLIRPQEKISYFLTSKRKTVLLEQMGLKDNI